MIVIDAPTIRALLPMRTCIALMRDAMCQLSAGQSTQMPRRILPVRDGTYGIMGGVVTDVFGSKLVSVRAPSAPDQASHRGAVLLFEVEDGRLLSVLEAGAITAIRTAAASALATDALARADARTMAILGTGEQAYHHALALCEVRPIERIHIWGRDIGKARRLAQRLQEETGRTSEAAETPAQCARGADIICTTTAASTPILHEQDVAPGTHVNIVGSSYAGPTEIGESLVAAGRLFGDSREAVLSQGSEFLNAKASGRIGDDHFLAEIGEILLGHHQGRTSPEDITLYKSLGHIVQDLVAAHHITQAAEASGLGVRIALNG